MIRRVMGTAVLLSALVASVAPAAAPDGPRLAFVKFGGKPAVLEVVTGDQAGAQQQVVAGGGKRVRPLPFPFSAPAWSPDGSLVAFGGFPGKLGGLGGISSLEIFIAASDGSGLHAIGGTEGGVEPVFAHDGKTLAFARYRIRGANSHKYRSLSVWTVGLDGSNLRRLTPWRNELEVSPDSFSPDDAVLAVSRRRSRHSTPEAVALHLDGSGSTVLASNAAEAVYSPDGSKIALVRVHEHSHAHKAKGIKATASVATTWDLFVMNADGSELRQLTRTPTKSELFPSWDPSGQRLAYNQLGTSKDEFLGFGDAIMEINVDGTCRIEALSYPNSVLIGPTWQPGPGREAGPISC